MLILTIRTDKPESELGLYIDTVQISYVSWEAHRQLAETINHKMQEILSNNGKNIEEVDGLVVYKGPGSFTGLRIGLSVANALSYSLGVPIVAETNGWIETGIKRLLNNENDKVTMPEYGAPVHITTPRK